VKSAVRRANLCGGGLRSRQNIGRLIALFSCPAAAGRQWSRIWRGVVWEETGVENQTAPADDSAGADGWGFDQFRDLANSSLFIALKIFHSSL
jgi:hypothetical protein